MGRWEEKIGAAALRVLNVVGLFRQYRPIHADLVASAMIHAAQRPEQVRIYEPDELFTVLNSSA